MKKAGFLFMIFFSLLSRASAQFNWGLKVGANLSNEVMAGADFKNKIDLNSGLFANIDLGNKFLLRTEFDYAAKGYKYNRVSPDVGTVTLNYLVVPLLAGYQPSKSIAFFLGPEFGFLTDANSRFDGANHNVTDNFRKFDISADVSVAYTLIRGIGVELRYEYGFKDLVNVTYTDPNGIVTGKGKDGSNRVLQMSVFIAVPK